MYGFATLKNDFYMPCSLGNFLTTLNNYPKVLILKVGGAQSNCRYLMARLPVIIWFVIGVFSFRLFLYHSILEPQALSCRAGSLLLICFSMDKIRAAVLG